MAHTGAAPLKTLDVTVQSDGFSCNVRLQANVRLNETTLVTMQRNVSRQCLSASSTLAMEHWLACLYGTVSRHILGF